jgi:large subunit ribosomal protein L10
MPTAEKEKAIAEFTELLRGSTAVIVTQNKGLNSEQVTQLRKASREAGVTLKVVKNTLAIRAAKAAGINGLDPFLTGPTAIAFTKGDFLAPAKVLTKFAKDNDKLVVMGGVMEGKAVDPAEVQTFASLPSKEELVAMLLRTINGPASGMARVINAIVEKKTAEGAA